MGDRAGREEKPVVEDGGAEAAGTDGRTPFPVRPPEGDNGGALRRLTEIARALNSEPDLHRLLDLVLDRVVDLARAERAFLVLRSGENKLQIAASRNFDREGVQRAAAKISRSILLQAEKSGRPVVTTNATMDPRFANSDSVAYMRLRAVLCIPLGVRGRSLGLLYLDNRFEEGVFRDLDLGLIEAFGAQAAIALENATFRESIRTHSAALEKEVAERRRAERRLATQNGVARVLAGMPKLVEAIPALLRVMGEELGWHAGAAWERGPETGTLRCAHAWSAQGGPLASFATTLPGSISGRGGGLPGRVRESKVPEWAADPAGDAAAGEGRPRTGVAFPFAIGDEVLGVIEFFHAEPLAKDRDLLAVLGNSGTQIGQFMERAHVDKARKDLETRLRQSQKMEAIGRLAGGVAHDFNNLLTVILGFGDLAITATAEDDPRRKYLGEMRSACRRATALTRQLLAFSRQQVLDKKVMDLNHVVGGMEKMIARIVGEDVELKVVLSPLPVRVRADASQLEQVLLNLVVNARDAMPTGGRLVVETAMLDLDSSYCLRNAPETTPGPFAMLAVTDTGVGIPKEVLPRIFEPFFTTKEVGKGTGLGLATVYGILRQSGGHVALYSEVGRGTTFKVYLPRLTSDEAEADAPPPAPAVSGGTETILLVEDDAQIRMLARTVLESAGYRVLEAESGKDAVERFDREGQQVRLVLTDVVMARMDGTELARGLLGRSPDLRVLFMSGYTGEALKVRGLLENADTFVEKPFTPDVLLRRVRAALDAPPAPPPAK